MNFLGPLMEGKKKKSKYPCSYSVNEAKFYLAWVGTHPESLGGKALKYYVSVGTTPFLLLLIAMNI